MPQPLLSELNHGREYIGKYTEEFADSNELVESVSMIVWYDSLEGVLCDLISALQTKRDCYSEDNFVLGISGFRCVSGTELDLHLVKAWHAVAMILVSRFGDYGSSPREGWIPPQRLQECINFLSYVLAAIPTDDSEDMRMYRRNVE